MKPEYASGVLNEETHGRLVAQLDALCEQAHVPPRAVYTPMLPGCSQAELAWIRDFNRHASEGKSGLALVGKWPRVLDRMHLMAGALIRNFIDARCWTVQEVAESARAGEVPSFTALFVPNFFASHAGTGQLPNWYVPELLRTLIHRHSTNKPTIVWVDDLGQLQKVYGDAMAQHVDSYFTKLGLKGAL